MHNELPGKIIAGFDIPLAAAIAFAFVQYWAAIAFNVSPDCTM
jgi:hypothetical protein